MLHFDNLLQSLTKQTLTTLSLYALSKTLISPLISVVISFTVLLFDLMMTSIKNILSQTQLNQNIIALNPTSTFQSMDNLQYTGLLET